MQPPSLCRSFFSKSPRRSCRSVEDGEDGTHRLSHAAERGDGTWGHLLVVHGPHPQRACLIRAVSSWTRLYTDRSSRIMRAILDVAWITVVWSRPPNSLPILGSDESVSSRERYIATCRGYATAWERLALQSSATDIPKRSETVSWIRAIETSGASP